MSKKVALDVMVIGNVQMEESARMAAALAIVPHIGSPANGLAVGLIRLVGGDS